MESDLEQRGGGNPSFPGSQERGVSPAERRELLERIERAVSSDVPNQSADFDALEEQVKQTLRNVNGDPELGFEMAEERLYPGYLVAFYLPNGQVFAGVNDVRDKAFLIAAEEALRAGEGMGAESQQ